MLKTDYLQYCLNISLGMNPDYIGLGRYTCLHDTVKGYIIKWHLHISNKRVIRKD